MKTRVTRLIGIEHPIFQGGMAWISDYHLAAAVSNAGAAGIIATGFDGYPPAKLGEAGKAIGISTTASVIGGVIGVIALAYAAPIISEYSLKFVPQDYFLLAIMGILLVGSLSGESLAKGGVAGALGILLSMVGMDNFTGQGRFTFGSVGLMSGIHFVAIMIGLFGVSEALVQLHDIDVKEIKQDVSRIVPSWRLLFKHMYLIIKCSFIGIGIGALPGAGGDIAALSAYGHTRRSVKHPTRPFGQGAYEGIIAPETANNACIGGAYIPMLTLRIPGDAVILGPLMETGYRQSMQDQQNNIIAFLTQLVVNPLSLILTLSIVFMVLGQTQFWGKLMAKFSRKGPEA